MFGMISIAMSKNSKCNACRFKESIVKKNHFHSVPSTIGNLNQWLVILKISLQAPYLFNNIQKFSNRWVHMSKYCFFDCKSYISAWVIIKKLVMQIVMRVVFHFGFQFKCCQKQVKRYSNWFGCDFIIVKSNVSKKSTLGYFSYKRSTNAGSVTHLFIFLFVWLCVSHCINAVVICLFYVQIISY